MIKKQNKTLIQRIFFNLILHEKIIMMIISY